MPSERLKAWDRSNTRGRVVDIRPRRRVLILCEDGKSATLYFKGFELDTRRVEVLPIGTGMNTDSLVENAIERKKEAIRGGVPFNEIWCVFDRDSFPAENFNRAFQLAENHGIFVAWANEAFEIWYLLHFNYHDTDISRADYARRLRALLHCEYDKADDQIYAKLEPYQPMAMKHAKRLEKHWIEMGGCNPERANPSTSIHKLVEFLNEFKDLGSAD